MTPAPHSKQIPPIPVQQLQESSIQPADPASLRLHQQFGHVVELDPVFALPFQQANGAARPVHRSEVGQVGFELIVQSRQYVMRNPASERSIFRDVVVDQHCEEPGFTDEQLFAALAIGIEPDGTALVCVEFPGGAFVEGSAHETGGVLKAEPGLVLQQERS